MAGLTLDAGALVAAERGAQLLRGWIERASDAGAEVTVPAPVVAQVWRAGPAQARLTRFLKGCIVEACEERTARQAGALLGARRWQRGEPEAMDAIVVVSASRRGPDEVVLTQDTGDLRALAALLPAGRRPVVATV